MDRKKLYRRERGQATMEVAIAAVAIVFLVMGFFILGGYGLTSIKSLLLTRYYAEVNAENKSFGSVASSRQLDGWWYTTVVQKKADGDLTLVIPFLARDEARVSIQELSSDYLVEMNPPLSFNPERAPECGLSAKDADYEWQPFDTLVTRQITSFNTAVLASLHRQFPVLPNEVDDKSQNYLFRASCCSGSGCSKCKNDGGWLDARRIDITEWESSVVAFPAFAPQK